MASAAPLALLAALLAQQATSGLMKQPGPPDNSPYASQPMPRNCAAVCADQRNRCLDGCRKADHKIPDRLCKHACDRNQDVCLANCGPQVNDELAGKSGAARPAPKPPPAKQPKPVESAKPPAEP